MMTRSQMNRNNMRLLHDPLSLQKSMYVRIYTQACVCMYIPKHVYACDWTWLKGIMHSQCLSRMCRALQQQLSCYINMFGKHQSGIILCVNVAWCLSHVQRLSR